MSSIIISTEEKSHIFKTLIIDDLRVYAAIMMVWENVKSQQVRIIPNSATSIHVPAPIAQVYL